MQFKHIKAWQEYTWGGQRRVKLPYKYTYTSFGDDKYVNAWHLECNALAYFQDSTNVEPGNIVSRAERDRTLQYVERFLSKKKLTLVERQVEDVYPYSSSDQRDHLNSTEKVMSVPKQSHLLALLQECNTAQVSFPDGGGKYTYKVTDALYKELAERLETEKRVIVIVPSNGDGINKGRMSIAYVNSVDDEPMIDVDETYEYRWVVGIPDFTEYEAQLERDGLALKAMKKAELREQQQKLINSMGYEGDVDEIKTLLLGQGE